ncbi:MAG: hypothetical protein A2Y93_11380 [Chloroflexi bacterium RBG_13_68_17]|nr:MAG: hypothetical protein A2Y93_11380 [Chloroflexi bacterium RBG_13_68_17]
MGHVILLPLEAQPHFPHRRDESFVEDDLDALSSRKGGLHVSARGVGPPLQDSSVDAVQFHRATSLVVSSDGLAGKILLLSP